MTLRIDLPASLPNEASQRIAEVTKEEQIRKSESEESSKTLR
jgi:hypothetical protein